PDIPWILLSNTDQPLSREALSSAYQPGSALLQRLYAMGIDSYQLIPHLARLQGNSRETFEGATGRLYLDELKQLHRRLVWAQIDQGIPKILGYTDPNDLYMESDILDDAAPQVETPDDQPGIPTETIPVKDQG
ncbi:MAG: penicillin-binding protein activator, partial [Chromatiales bacterium]|nr:penicillin-binding protein activator [Chromatiales bacterium]